MIGNMGATTRQPYRVTLALSIDVWAEDEQEAEELAVNHLIDDHVPAFVVERMGANANEWDTDDGGWNPINEEDE